VSDQWEGCEEPAHDIAYRDLERKCKALEADYAVSNRELLILQVEISRLNAELARLTAELAELKETKITDIEKGLFFGKPVEYWLRLQNQAQESTRDKDIEEILLLKSLVFAREQDLNELHIELSQLRERTRWIPVSERLPEPPTTCLTFCEDWVEEDYFDSKGWLSGKPVTHWMPLPEPPEEIK